MKLSPVTRNKAKREANRQGSIMSFVKTQPSSSLLKSKDGLKQGKIDPFMKSKKSPSFYKSSSTQNAKRPHQHFQSETSGKKKKLDLTNINDDVIVASPVKSATRSTSNIQIQEESESDEFCTAPNSQISSSSDYYDASDKRFVNTIPGSPVLKKKKVLRRNDANTTKVMPSSKNIQLSVERNIPDSANNCGIFSHGNIVSNEGKTFDNNTIYGDLTMVENEQKSALTTSTVNEINCRSENTSSIPASHCVEDADLLCTLNESDDSLMGAFMDENDDCGKSKKVNQEIKMNKHAYQWNSDKFSSNLLHKIRHKVMKVYEGEDENGYFVKRAHVRNENLHYEVEVELGDNWSDSNIEPGDIINIIPDNEKDVITSTVKVNMRENLFVQHPDFLISGTTVSNSLGCMRRAVLSERFKNTEQVGTENVTNVMLIGTILHSVFQKALMHDKPLKFDELKQLATKIICDRRFLSDMLAVSTTQQAILKEVDSFIPRIESWIAEYRRKVTTRGVGKIDMNLPVHTQGSIQQQSGRTHKYQASMAMTQVIDIEENVWSPRFGLKGKIDVTGKLKIKNNQTQDEMETILPVEIKTGKESHSMEHHIQVAVYSMFCDERRNMIGGDVGSLPAGLLLYIKSGKTSCLPLKNTDKSGVMILRNKIADFLTKSIRMKSDCSDEKIEYQTLSFPETITNNRICQYCSQLRNCALVYKSVDSPQSCYKPSSDLHNMMSQHLSHLTNDDFTYFEHWMTCTLLENQEANRKNKQLRFWLKTPKERSDDGTCITNLTLAGLAIKDEHTGQNLQTFKRSRRFPISSIKEAKFEVGEMVLISGVEPEFIAMATAVIQKITNDFITVATDRDFSGYNMDMKYSIDHHVWLSQISVQSSLSNLSILMDNDPQCNRLRQLIIGHREPSFKGSLDFIPRSSKDAVASMLRGLNRTQRQAIKRVLLSNDYTLVVGMPGSGKTTTIVAMIRILLLCGLRVLVTSYTHSAVDNLLIKLIKYKVKFLRLGRTSQVHPIVQPYTEDNLSRDFTDTAQLQKLYDQSRVVGCTCLAVTSHAFFAIPGHARPIFDVCIVDEASQIAQPTCLSPLIHAKRFVLVGDHQQLPPLVVSNEAKKMGADESLFRRMTQHKSALCELTLQYRMNSDIMGVSNHVTYEGRLECAHPSVAVATVSLGKYTDIKRELESGNPEDSTWLVKAVDPKTSVLFLDTSDMSACEEEVEKGIINRVEASLVAKITNYLIKAGCHSNQIGIIAPFRKQLKAIEEEVSASNAPDVEINTVDKYQGRDKSVILLSFVRSNKEHLGEKKGELLSDWRRLNVAITRAKHKLVMVGCTRTLVQYDPCKKLIDYLVSNNMVVSL